MKLQQLLLLLGLLLGVVCCKKEEEKLNDTDRGFMTMAASGNYNEIDAGQLAASKAIDRSVKDFATMMISDHETAQNDLVTLASKKNATLPAGPDAAHMAIKNQLMQMSGHAFDSAYIHGQLTDHQTVLNLFKNEQNNGKDQDVKNYATKYLPIIQMHLNRADSTAKRF